MQRRRRRESPRPRNPKRCTKSCLDGVTENGDRTERQQVHQKWYDKANKVDKRSLEQRTMDASVHIRANAEKKQVVRIGHSESPTTRGQAKKG